MRSRPSDPGLAPPSRIALWLGALALFLVLIVLVSAPAAALEFQVVTGCSTPGPDIYCIFGEPAVSPGGDCIAFTNATTYPPSYEWWPGLAFARLGSGTCPSTVTGASLGNWHQSPAWSPDGAHLAFVSDGPDIDRSGIWTVDVGDAVGSSLRQIVAEWLTGDPAWSLDGTTIAFVKSDGIHVVPSAGGPSPLLVAGGRTPSWGPDGQIVFERGGDLWIRRTDGTEHRLTDTPETDATPAWSPQGVWIAYVSNRNGNWDLWVVAATGGTPVRVTATPEEEGHPSWTAAGDRLVFIANDTIWTATGLPDWTVSIERQSWSNVKSLFR